MKALVLTAAATALCLSSPASAELTAQELLTKLDQGDRETRVFLTGIGIGIGWANTSSDEKLFCQPAKLAMTPEQEVRMIRDIIQEDSRLADIPVGYVLMAAYIRTFPCSG